MATSSLSTESPMYCANTNHPSGVGIGSTVRATTSSPCATFFHQRVFERSETSVRGMTTSWTWSSSYAWVLECAPFTSGRAFAAYRYHPGSKSARRPFNSAARRPTPPLVSGAIPCGIGATLLRRRGFGSVRHGQVALEADPIHRFGIGRFCEWLIQTDG